jgi:hypothetical protein
MEIVRGANRDRIDIRAREQIAIIGVECAAVFAYEGVAARWVPCGSGDEFSAGRGFYCDGVQWRYVADADNSKAHAISHGHRH